MTKKLPKSKTKKWWADRNARRKQRYAEDPAYRAKVAGTARDGYRATHDVERKTAAPQNGVSAFGKTRKVLAGGRVVTFSIEEMGEMLGGYNKIVVYRWIKSGKFPVPPLMAADDNGIKRGVYGLAHAKRIAAIFAEHQKVKWCLHAKDSETVSKLLKAV